MTRLIRAYQSQFGVSRSRSRPRQLSSSSLVRTSQYKVAKSLLWLSPSRRLVHTTRSHNALSYDDGKGNESPLHPADDAVDAFSGQAKMEAFTNVFDHLKVMNQTSVKAQNNDDDYFENFMGPKREIESPSLSSKDIYHLRKMLQDEPRPLKLDKCEAYCEVFGQKALFFEIVALAKEMSESGMEISTLCYNMILHASLFRLSTAEIEAIFVGSSVAEFKSNSKTYLIAMEALRNIHKRGAKIDARVFDRVAFRLHRIKHVRSIEEMVHKMEAADYVPSSAVFHYLLRQYWQIKSDKVKIAYEKAISYSADDFRNFRIYFIWRCQKSSLSTIEYDISVGTTKYKKQIQLYSLAIYELNQNSRHRDALALFDKAKALAANGRPFEAKDMALILLSIDRCHDIAVIRPYLAYVMGVSSESNGVHVAFHPSLNKFLMRSFCRLGLKVELVQFIQAFKASQGAKVTFEGLHLVLRSLHGEPEHAALNNLLVATYVEDADLLSKSHAQIEFEFQSDKWRNVPADMNRASLIYKLISLNRHPHIHRLLLALYQTGEPASFQTVMGVFYYVITSKDDAIAHGSTRFQELFLEGLGSFTTYQLNRLLQAAMHRLDYGLACELLRYMNMRKLALKAKNVLANYNRPLIENYQRTYAPLSDGFPIRSLIQRMANDLTGQCKRELWFPPTPEFASLSADYSMSFERLKEIELSCLSLHWDHVYDLRVLSDYELQSSLSLTEEEMLYLRAALHRQDITLHFVPVPLFLKYQPVHDDHGTGEESAEELGSTRCAT